MLLNTNNPVLVLFTLSFLFVSDPLVESRETDPDGRPLLHMTPPDISVRSFSQLSMLLLLTNDRKLKEVQACLEGTHVTLETFLYPDFRTYTRPKVIYSSYTIAVCQKRNEIILLICS